MHQIEVTREQELIIPRDLAAKSGIGHNDNFILTIGRDTLRLFRCDKPTFSLLNDEGRLSYETLINEDGDFVIHFEYVSLLGLQWEDVLELEVNEGGILLRKEAE